MSLRYLTHEVTEQLNLLDQLREKEYESAQKLHFSLLSIVNERDGHPKNSQAYHKLSNQLHQSLNQLLSEIRSLRAHLERLAESKKLTLREKERRSLMIEELLNKHKQLQTSLNSSNNARASLLGEYQSLGASNHTAATATFEHIPHQDLRQIQAQAIAEQDRGLEELSKIIGRQKEMARAIGDEVESQNDLIDNITDGVDRTRDRMAQQTTRIGLVDRKDRSCGYWMVIIGLMIAIIVVASIPKI